MASHHNGDETQASHRGAEGTRLCLSLLPFLLLGKICISSQAPRLVSSSCICSWLPLLGSLLCKAATPTRFIGLISAYPRSLSLCATLSGKLRWVEMHLPQNPTAACISLSSASLIGMGCSLTVRAPSPVLLQSGCSNICRLTVNYAQTQNSGN